MDFMTAAELVISGKAFGKDSTVESVNEIRSALAQIEDLIGQVTNRFDEHLKSGRMTGQGKSVKIINADYLKGVKFFRKPQGWEDEVTTSDVLAGLAELLNKK